MVGTGVLLAMVIAIAGVPAVSASDALVVEQQVGPEMTATRQGEVITYDHAVSLPGATLKDYLGTREAGSGCSYSGGGSVEPGAGSVVYIEREIRQDLRVCRMTVEWSSLTPEQASEAGLIAKTVVAETTTAFEQGQGGNGMPVAAPGDVGIQSHTGRPWFGHLKTYYEEPVQGDTSTVEAHVGWAIGGGCVTSWGTHAYWHWLNDTGWTDVSRWADWPGGCSERTARVYGLFKNGVFCLTNDTFNEYNTTSYTGEADGGAHWSWNSKKWGGCNWLLSHHVEACYLGVRQ